MLTCTYSRLKNVLIRLNIFKKNSYLLYLRNIQHVAGPVEDRIEDAGEGEHGEEGSVQVAGVLVALDTTVPSCHLWT